VKKHALPHLRQLLGYRAWQLGVLLVAGLVLLPAVVPTFDLYLVEEIISLGLLAVSVDLMYGYAGLPSLGQAAYFGLGGYCVALMMLKGGITAAWIVVPAGIASGALAAAAFGLVALRTRGFQFLLVTFAFGQLLAAVAIRWQVVQNFGTEGLVGVTMPNIGLGIYWWGNLSTYYGACLVLVVSYAWAKALAWSPLGHLAQGLRENEARMQAFGYNTWWCKYKIMIAAGGLAALGGELFAFTSGAILPSDMDYTYSGLAFLMVVLGGAGTIDGALLGAVVIILLQHFVSLAAPARWPLVLGVVFLGSAVAVRGGLTAGIARAVSVGGRYAQNHGRWKF